MYFILWVATFILVFLFDLIFMQFSIPAMLFGSFFGACFGTFLAYMFGILEY